MHDLRPAVLAFFLVALPVAAQQSAPWHDPSPHKVQFVTVDKDVKLEVLDWGGRGRPIVLLAGQGDTAHIFDDFARRLTILYHVFGISRRGYGVSNVPATGYSADRLADDVLAVLDALKLDRPVLVGHSIAGEELSSIGSRHPERVAGLVYLDAGYSYAFYDSSRGDSDIRNYRAPVPLAPTDADRVNYQAWQSWQKRNDGYAMPEGELRQLHQTTPEGHVGDVRIDASVQRAVADGHQKFTNIRGPILAIFAVPHDPGPFLKDDAVRAEFDARDAASTGAQATAFEKGVPSAHVVRIPHATHYVFLSNEADVLREMRAFIEHLP